jgi:fructose-1,6-bisphosphatase II / sedoheptulose-1,7-bisphosphatase
LSIDAVRLTREAAIACYEWIGKGQEKEADKAAVAAMRKAFNNVSIDGTIVIGEGERDNAPMLYVGEKVGNGSLKVDIAVDPLEGTTICAHALPNSISVMAMATEGGLLRAPDVYMDKIAVGPGLPNGVVDLDNTPQKNIQNYAKATNIDIEDIVVTVLKRPRHDELVAKIREAGARIKFISDGDVLGVISNCIPDSGTHIYMGIGGAPEGVLAAAALKTLGGQMQARLQFNTDEEIKRAAEVGIRDRNRKYVLDELASGNTVFAATGVTDGWYLNGVKYKKDYTCVTHSIVMDSSTQTIKRIELTSKL